MDKVKIAKELVRLARELTGGGRRQASGKLATHWDPPLSYWDPPEYNGPSDEELYDLVIHDCIDKKRIHNDFEKIKQFLESHGWGMKETDLDQLDAEIDWDGHQDKITIKFHTEIFPKSDDCTPFETLRYDEDDNITLPQLDRLEDLEFDVCDEDDKKTVFFYAIGYMPEPNFPDD